MDKERVMAFQSLLYKNPLYTYVGSKERNMNILILGWNENMAAFVDQCLQAGQMNSHDLMLQVLAESAEENSEIYGKKRPALSRFIDIDGSLTEKCDEKYATLTFTNFDIEYFKDTDVEEQEDILLDILADAPNEKYHYFMVDLGEDIVNEKIAKVLKNVADTLIPTEKNLVHFVVNHKAEQEIADVLPVYIHEQLKITDICPELERMAYNAHLTWDDSINGDYIAEMQAFKSDEYNYLSSIAMALSIPYKLADLGIVLDNNYETVAQEFYEKIHDDINAELVSRMIELEHRRWLIYMCCDGWDAPEMGEEQTFYDECISRCSMKNAKEKIHPCIVRSSTATPLSTGEFSRKRILWDMKTDKDSLLEDNLDRMSVEVHRRMLVKANAFKKSDPLHTGEIRDIRKLVGKCNSDLLNREMERYIFCIKNILDGNWAYSKQYKRYQESFVKVLDRYDVSGKSDIENCLEKFNKKIWPVIEANLYRDYKKNDEVLVRKIPFILTYNVNLSLVMAFRTTTSLNVNDTIFKNVASATVIKPGKIIYLLYLEDSVNRDNIRQMIRAVSQYMRGKGIHCDIKLLISGLKSYHQDQIAKWVKTFDSLKHQDYITDFVINFTSCERETIDFWIENLKMERINLYDGSSNPFQSLQANGELLKAIQGMYPYFEFECRDKTFKNNDSCKYLSYIEDHTYLGIEEMFGLVGAEDMEYNYPVLGDEYKRLWNIYIGRNRGNKNRWKNNIRYSVKTWNVMCDTLEKYDECHAGCMEVDLKALESGYHGYQKWSDVLGILKELCGEFGGKQYLIPQKENGKMIGFQYSNDDIKNVLTKAGDILEIYTFFKLCEEGYFDEIACGYRFSWEDDKINNELDLVLTKGFQSLIIECKARSKLDQNFYFKLSSLADLFGIGVNKVLLTTAKTDEGDNRMQKERGNILGIRTISDIDEIQNIGDELKKLL